MPRLYVYKCRNDPHTEYSAYGEWTDVFDKSGPVSWGGAWATKSPTSIEIFEDELSTGDLILAWQTDKGAAIGVAEVVGTEVSDLKWLDNSADKGYVIDSVEHVLLEARERFPRPVRLHVLKKTTHPELARVPCLQQGYVETIYRTTRADARKLLRACKSRYAVDFK
jgi:hypothetical protein